MAGTGALAPYLIAAALYCLPRLKTVYVANPHHPECSAAACAAIVPQVEKLLSACGGCHAAIIAEPSLETAAKQSDVILTATPAREPFLKAEWVRPGTHISCLGADMTGKQEIDSALFSGARVFGDDATQCLSAGECEIPYKTGAFDGTLCDIGSVISGAVPGRIGGEDITIFDSTGIALQDISTAAALLDAARKNGQGQIISL
jgi:alanine dehydrogenase